MLYTGVTPLFTDLFDWIKEFTFVIMIGLGFLWYRAHYNKLEEILDEVRKHNKREEERDFEFYSRGEVKNENRN